jgi:hypothetical protein
MDKHITKCLYGKDYKYNTSLRVIGAALRMQKGYLQKVQRVGKEKAKYIEKPQIRDTLCNLFHIGHDAYSDIVGGYLHNQSIYQSGMEGGGGRKDWQFHGKGEPNTLNNGDADQGARFCSQPSVELPESYWMPSP